MKFIQSYINYDMMKNMLKNNISKCTINDTEEGITIIVNINENNKSIQVKVIDKEENLVKEYIMKINNNQFEIKRIFNKYRNEKDLTIFDKLFEMLQIYDDSGKILSVVTKQNSYIEDNIITTVFENIYDNKGRLVQLVEKEDNNIIARNIYYYFKINNQLCAISNNGYFDQYDDNNRLIHQRKVYAHKKHIDVSNVIETDYKYDENGNIIKRIKTKYFNTPITNTFKTKTDIIYNKYNLPLTCTITKLRKDESKNEYITIKYDYEF